MKRYLTSFFAVPCGVCVECRLWAGETADWKDLKYGPIHPERRIDSAMEAFRDYGFGQFIHWGLYAILGNE